MKVKGLILGLGMMTGLAILAPVNSQAWVAEDQVDRLRSLWMECRADSCRNRTGNCLSRWTK